MGERKRYVKDVFMGRYIIRRLIMSAIIIFLTAILIFTVVYLIPTDPVKLLMGNDVTEEEVEFKRHEMGLDAPYIVQLGRFLNQLFLHADFGTSWRRGTSVSDELFSRMPRSAMIGITCALISTAIAIPLGVTAARHQNQWQDRFCSVFGMMCVSIPDFWLALMMVILFGLKLGWLPSFGIGSWKHYVMPIIAGSLHGVGTLARQTRSSMLEVIRSDYITTARAKGLAERKVVYKHMLPNALIPVITVVGQTFSRIIGGSVVIEQVFSIPGVGTYMTTAVQTRDYPITRACVVFLSAFTAIMLIIVDLAYAYVDPRIKAQYIGQVKRKVKNNG